MITGRIRGSDLGAGTYELSWLHDRPIGLWKIRDAHNLYVEVLAELGPIGLALLLLALSVPIFAAVKVRRHPLVLDRSRRLPRFRHTRRGRLGLGDASSDDRRLFCGVAIIAVTRSGWESRPLSQGASARSLALSCGFCVHRTDGQSRNCGEQQCGGDSNWKHSALHAGDAKRWMPWSSDPWRLQGEAQYVMGNFNAARANFRKAISKDPNNWLLWADLATVGTHGTWRAPARRALELNPLAPELAEFRRALGVKG